MWHRVVSLINAHNNKGRKQLAMKSKLYRTLLFCVSSAFLTGTALAQRDSTLQPPGGSSSTLPGSTVGKEFGHGMMHGAGHEIRGSKIIGAQVKGSTGENLGTIEDIIINPRNGRAEFAVLSVSGPSGTTTTTTTTGEKLTPIPWRLLSPSSSSQFGATGTDQVSFTANVDQSKLSSAPTFDKNQWPDMNQSGWSQKYYSHYGLSNEGTGGTGSGLDNGTGLDKDKSTYPPSIDKGTGTYPPSTEKGAGASGLQPK